MKNKKDIFIVFFLIALFLNINSYCVEYHLRTTFEINDKNKNKIGIKTVLGDTINDYIRRTIIYILNNGYFLQLIYQPSNSYETLQALKNKIEFTKKSLKTLKDVGLETEYKLIVNVNGEICSFTLLGDSTYLYLKDEKGIKRMNEEAFEYLISKVPEIRDFIEIMACDDKFFLRTFLYVLNKKDVKKKLSLDVKKYNLIVGFQRFTEVEKSLGYDCSIYAYYAPCHPKGIFYLF